MKDLRFGQSPDRLVCPSLLLFALRMAEGFIRFSSGVRSKLAVGWNFGLSTHWSQTGKAPSFCRTIFCCRSILLLFFNWRCLFIFVVGGVAWLTPFSFLDKLSGRYFFILIFILGVLVGEDISLCDLRGGGTLSAPVLDPANLLYVRFLYLASIVLDFVCTVPV
ncbi:unnamed protein product [Brassica oleracea var. botrytis]